VVALGVGAGLTGTTTAFDDATAGAGAASAGVTLERISSIAGTTAMAVRHGDPALYVTTQRGRVMALRPAEEPVPVLDLTALTRSGGERGLLGLVFSPDGRRLYVHYSGVAAGETVLEEYAMHDGVVDPTTRRVLLTVPQPQPNHNGGQLAFGPDGYLYLGLGDGGGRDDRGPGHAPEGNGQSLATLLGKILRIDPRPSGGMPYTVPADNPFASGGGRPEIYVWGLRNPWRFSFDHKKGDLWVADVGQDRWEEVTRIPAGRIAGANLGWNLFEGTHRFRDGPATPVVMPQIETSHDDGNCSITGGYVYRGKAIPSLRGWYLFTDYCNGAIKAARINKAGPTRVRDLGVALSAVSSFGRDADGEIYVLSQESGVFRLRAS
jgi:glucose/arabinose dehydrogenase